MSFGNEREFIDYLLEKEGKTMKCPVQQGLLKSEGDRTVIEWPDCLKEECAWWDKHCQSCSVYEISRSLMEIFDVLVEIKEKMPHKLQFRKV